MEGLLTSEDSSNGKEDTKGDVRREENDVVSKALTPWVTHLVMNKITKTCREKILG